MRRSILCSLLLVIISSSTLLFAQAWKASLPEDERNFYSIQRSFNQYWEGKDTRQKGKGWKQFKRWEWFWEQRVYPSGMLPAPDILQTTMKEYKTRYRQQNANSAGWTIIGPSVVPDDGGGAGRVNSVIVHPTNTNILFAGSASGGLWKSTNGGSSWTTNTDEFGTLGVSAIVFDPADPNIMYIATGDADAGDTYSIGVLKSNDGGTTWNTTGLTFSTSSVTTIRALVIHPTNGNILLATTGSGIYRTTNAGASWNLTATGSFRDLEVNKTDPTIWYATRNSNGIYKSTDTGNSFSLLSGVGLPTSGYGRIAISIAESSPSTVYALYVNLSDGFYGLYRTTNAGAGWTLQSNSPNILSWDGTGSDGQGWYDLVLDVNPTNPAIIYTGGVNLYKSTTGGSSWLKISHWYTGAGYPYVHADQHGFAFHPGNSNTVYAANDGGVFKSTTSGTSWTDLSGGLAITQFYRLGTSATNVNRIYAGAQDNGTNRVLNGSWSQIIGGDGMEALIDYSDENIGYGELYYGAIYRTTNGGNNFSNITGAWESSEGSAWVTPYIINPINPKSLYLGTTKVYKTTNRGTTWTTISGALSGSYLSSLAVAKSDTNWIYAGTSSAIFRTTNGGGAWTNITSGLPSASKTYIAVHPNNPQIVYVTLSGYGSEKVYKTTNGGSSWANMSSGLPSVPTNCIAIHPTSTNNLYVGTDVGVYYSSDAGSSWQSFSLGLPNVVVTELEFHATTNKLRAATYGRGIWETSTGSGTGSVFGKVFFDANNNGSKDASETGLHNWKVRLSGDRTDSTITDLNGDYAFSSLPDGNYSVTLEQQGGWTLNSPVSGNYSVSINEGTTHGDKNFVNYVPGIYESFDGASFPPAGWVTRIVLGDSGWRKTTITPRSGTTAAFNRYQSPGMMGTKMLITKRIALGAGTKELRFWVRRESEEDKQPDTLNIKLSTTDSITASFTTLLYRCYSGDTTIGNPNVYSTQYTEFVVPLTGYSGPVFLAFEHRNNNGQSLYLDDVLINVGSLGPAFSSTPASLSFGNIGIGASKRDSITVTNIGSSTLSISAVSSNSNQFLVSPLNGTIASFGSKKYYITFFPTSGGLKNASIIFTSNAATSADSVPVSGMGSAPAFSAVPSPLSFGDVRVGESAMDSIIVTNTGTETLSITAVSSSNARFTITPTTATLAPSDSQAFSVTFSPLALGSISSNLYFSHNAGSQSLVVANGNGISAGFTPSPSQLTMGKSNLGESIIDSFAISNTGDALLTISSVVSSNAQFVLLPTDGTIEPDSSLWFTVTFTPSTIGEQISYFMFTHDGLSTPDTVTATGRGADTIKLRTFRADTALAAKSSKLKPLKGKPALLPNVANWRDSVIYRFDKKKGVVLGLMQTGRAAMNYGWIRFMRGGDFGKFYKQTQTTIAYNAPFDTIRKEGSTKKRKRFVREFKASSDSYTNPLAQAFGVFKLNLYSSKLGITPKGLDSLVYVSEGSPWNGMTLSQIANKVDSVLTKYNETPLPGGTFASPGLPQLEELRTLLNSVNEAFTAPIALANGDSVVAGQGLKFAGAVGLHTIPFLDKVSGAVVEPMNWFSLSAGEPVGFELLQNYPNPFNPTTTIRFAMQDAGFITLKVYNMLGQEVAALINNEAMESGEHELSFDAARFPSGVYFYRINVESIDENGMQHSFSDVKRMLMIK